jgi:hypothetical protein
MAALVGRWLSDSKNSFFMRQHLLSFLRISSSPTASAPIRFIDCLKDKEVTQCLWDIKTKGDRVRILPEVDSLFLQALTTGASLD